MLKSLFRDSVIYTIPTFITNGLSLILAPLYTRMLTPTDYGSLDLLTVFGSIVRLTVALEVTQGLARYYLTEKDAEEKVVYASTALWFSAVCYTLFLIVAFTFSKELSALVFGEQGLELYFRLGSIYIAMHGVQYLLQSQFRWEFRSTNFITSSLIVMFTTPALSILLAYGFGWGLTGVLCGQIGGYLAGIGYGIWNLRNSFRFRFDRVRLKQMLLYSVPLVPSGVAVFANNYADRVILNSYMSLGDVGLYSIGFKLASSAGLVLVGFRNALTPLIYAHYSEPGTPRELARIFRWFVGFALAAFLLLSIFATEIFYVLTPPTYYPASQIVVFLVPAVLLSNMYIFFPGIDIAKKTYLILTINFVVAVLNVLFCLWLIPLYGVAGAAVATLLGYGCMFFFYLWFSQKLYFVPHDWKRLGGTVVLVSLLAYWLPKFQLSSIFLAVGFKLIGVILGVGVILGAGLLPVSELKKLYNMVGIRVAKILRKDRA
jgi:O-antigen/teichoic acid export membrane protein